MRASPWRAVGYWNFFILIFYCAAAASERRRKEKMGLVWTARFVALLHVTFAAKLQLSLPEKLYVTEGASLTINCSFSPPSTDLNHIIVKWFMMSTYYSENMSMHDITKIYNSGIDIASTGVATFVGNVEKGDCSLRLLHISSSLHPVFRCQVICGQCNTDNIVVEGEVMLNVTAAAVTSAVKLQLFLPESVDVTEGESVTLPCSFSPPSTVSGGLYITWLTMPTGYVIYDSLLGNVWLERAEFAGDKEKGDCSLRVLNVSRTLSPVFKCDVICISCGTNDLRVEREVKLNVTAAAPRSHGGGVSDATLVPLEETSHKGLVVAAWVLGPLAVIVIIIVVFFWMKRHRSSGLCPHSRSGGGNADVPGDVRGEVNGQPLMNGHEEKKQQVLETVAVL